MKGKDIFKKWAPKGAKWVDWVRPVPFIALDNSAQLYELGDFKLPSVNYITKLLLDTAIFVDLPGNDSIKEGLALAKIGFRPVPIYNGTNQQQGAMATVDNQATQIGLIKGASELEKIQIGNNAPPVFLLDSNRTHRFKMNASVFDNSWDIYDQDIPSAEYFLKNGITNIIIRGQAIQKDLSKILYKFQKAGIKILFTNGYEEPKVVVIKKPSKKENNQGSVIV